MVILKKRCDWNMKYFLTDPRFCATWLPDTGSCSWVVQSLSLRQPPLRLMSGNFVSKYCINLQDRILSQLSNYIIYRMSWQWSLYSYEPSRLDCFADSVLQLHWNESKQYFNACENVSQKMIAQSDGQPCWHWSEQGMCHHVSLQCQVSLLSAVLGPCQWPEPRPAPPDDVILVIIFNRETFHISKHFCDAAAKVRMCFVCHLSVKDPRYSEICHDASGINL